MIDHPGTTVQALGAVVIVARWIPSRVISGAASIQDAVLSAPEDYLTAISVVLATLIAAATFAVGLRALRIWRSLLPALVIQLSLLLFTQGLMALPKVSPEPLLIVATLILLLALTPAVVGTAERPAGHWHAVRVGVAIGFGLATKFTFLPLLGFVVLVDGWRKKAIALMASGVAFVVFTFPIWPKYHFLREWLVTLATHTGVNGSGDSGLPAASTLIANVNYLMSVASPLFALLGLYLILVVVFRLWNPGLAPDEMAAITRLLLVSCVIISAQIALAAKNLGAHYLLPSMVASALTNGLLVLTLVRNMPRGWPQAVSRIAVAAAMSVGLVLAATGNMELIKDGIADVDEARSFERLTALEQGTVVGYYRSSLPQYALAFGNDFAKDKYDGALRALYPDAVFYSIWLGRFYSFGGDLSEDEIRRLLASGRVVLLYGSPFVGDYVVYRKGLSLDPVFLGLHAALYRLTGIDAAP
jgi:hypothetical protein